MKIEAAESLSLPRATTNARGERTQCVRFGRFFILAAVKVRKKAPVKPGAKNSMAVRKRSDQMYFRNPRTAYPHMYCIDRSAFNPRCRR